MNVNKVILVGNITRDPEVRSTTSGQTVATLGIATNRYWTDKNTGQKQEQVEFHNVVLWGRLGELAGQYLTKGSQVYIEGRLQHRSYTGKDGVERKVTEVVGETMQFGRRAQGQGTPDSRPSVSQAAPKESSPAEEIPTINLDEEQDEVKIEDVPF